MFKYENAEMEVVRFDAENVVATSATSGGTGCDGNTEDTVLPRQCPRD